MPTARANNAPAPRRTALTAAAETLIDGFASRRPLRAGSLLITVFGDAIAPRGGTVWLGSLIRALEPFGINQRLVRTSVFRLSRPDDPDKAPWLSATQIGRRSFYSLTGSGRARFAAASERIYSEPRHDWSGTWCLVLLSAVDGAHREPLRRELKWLGFAPFSASLLAHPAPDLAELEQTLQALPQNDRVVVMEAQAPGDRAESLRKLARDAFDVDALGARYRAFVKRFRPVLRAATRARAIDPAQGFAVRTLLIHEYRKIVLRDPLLPDALLPRGWDGEAAYRVSRDLYARVATAAERYLTDNMETADGPLPPAQPSFFDRFGGIA